MKFRLRFSVRTLANVVTLVCAYFGAWEVTKRYAFELQRSTVFSVDGRRQISKVDALIEMFAADHLTGKGFEGLFYVADADSPAPFVITTYGVIKRSRFRTDNELIRRHYLWLFGPTIKLPFESELK